MAEQFQIECLSDTGRNRVYFLCQGRVDSAHMTDVQIAWLKSLDAPWTMDRIIDISDCAGGVAYADLIRLSQYWSSIKDRAPRAIRVAVVSADPHMAPRRQGVGLLFEKHEFGYFPTRALAEAWLDERPAMDVASNRMPAR